ncbi:unnamed protein product [Rotaria magnacalcarata]|uniref:Uncharacterized protein n=1 Tax=Rotaria magnacalcarata TaxID=392030 RepID=A0A816PUL2_9BILA|nr:unnamed protein product [Rotaria magnacalcarata]CAF1489192.1 unnamed protein product [Rotaria magnacalcarata]CAF2052728.1 unnamed protein product [Rotaria magnacalcarata]CAF3749884.1 unnamed protein product [Rotaria magnacalcarata]CAF3783244.1 unnamed protein product [Rotaria magnacalcarata]
MGFFDLHEPEDGQDRFFLYAMIVLPFFATGSYLFDALYHYKYHSKDTYGGLISTIMIVFAYLQYCAPIRSRRALILYYVLLCMVKEAASIVFILGYIRESDIFKIVCYICFFIVDLLFTAALIHCRVINNYESHIVVENKHLFHFMSRLEVILTIFIPVYMNIKYASLTRYIIAHFLLFDFFSDSYSRFQGIWIKSAIYLFVIITTVSAATEWLHFNHQTIIYEEISYVAEIIANALCDSIIILQFFPFHFKTQFVQNIFRDALLLKKQSNAANLSTSIGESTEIDIAQNIDTKIDERTRTNMSELF